MRLALTVALWAVGLSFFAGCGSRPPDDERLPPKLTMDPPRGWSVFDTGSGMLLTPEKPLADGHTWIRIVCFESQTPRPAQAAAAALQMERLRGGARVFDASADEAGNVYGFSYSYDIRHENGEPDRVSLYVTKMTFKVALRGTIIVTGRWRGGREALMTPAYDRIVTSSDCR